MSPPRKTKRGSLVLVAFCLTAVIGIALASYFNACFQALKHSNREYHNHQARYLAEVGLEEALWQLNNGMTWSGSGPASSTSWTGTNSKVLSVTGYTLGAGATGTLSVSVNTTTYRIVSTATLTVAGSIYTKTLTADTQRASAFPNAVASASGKVYFNNSSTSVYGLVNSYDSSFAYAAGTATFAAVVAGTDIQLTYTDVRGYLETFGNTPQYANSTVFGSGGSGVDSSRLGKSAFIPLFPVTTWSGSWASTPNPYNNDTSYTLGSNNGATLNYLFSGDYSLTGNRALTINGPVRLVVTGDFSISSTARIRLSANTTASLEMFVGGNVTVTSSSAFQNRAPTATAPAPSRLALYVTGSNKTVNWNSTARFDGVLYSTHRDAGTITIANSGATPAFYGAILSNRAITFSGAAPYFHYDSNLRTVAFPAISTPFIITSLSEIATER